jgi:hypothetical protein
MKMMKCALGVIAIVTCLVVSPAQGEELAEPLRYKVSSFSMELTQCYAYYSLISHCAENASARDLEKQTADIAASLTPLIYQTGKMAGLLQTAMLGRIQMALDSIKADIGNSCINIAAIYAKYAAPCKSLVENPETRLREILGR